MECAAPPDDRGRAEAAFGAALEGFGRLLRAIWNEASVAAGGSSDAGSIGTRLVAEFDRWLRDPASIPPWWRNLASAAPLAQPSFPFGPPFESPVGFSSPAPPPTAGNELLRSLQHTVDLVLRASQLQAQLATHWSTIARGAVEKFSVRARSPAADLELTNIHKLYDSWIECAEEAYAAVVRTDEFCRTQAALVNVMTALLLEQRRHLERFARSYGLPTRSELDALRAQLRQIQDELRRGPPRRRSTAPRRKRAHRRKRAPR